MDNDTNLNHVHKGNAGQCHSLLLTSMTDTIDSLLDAWSTNYGNIDPATLDALDEVLCAELGLSRYSVNLILINTDISTYSSVAANSAAGESPDSTRRICPTSRSSAGGDCRSSSHSVGTTRCADPLEYSSRCDQGYNFYTNGIKHGFIEYVDPPSFEQLMVMLYFRRLLNLHQCMSWVETNFPGRFSRALVMVCHSVANFPPNLPRLVYGSIGKVLGTSRLYFVKL